MAGRPSARIAARAPLRAVSTAVNAPCSNSNAHDRLGQQRQADRCRQRKAERQLERRAIAHARSRLIIAAYARVNRGISTVPIATPTMPSGSSTRRLAK